MANQAAIRLAFAKVHESLDELERLTVVEPPSVEDLRRAIEAELAIQDKGERVYFIQVGFAGPVKIGRAKDPLKRLGQLQVSNHSELQLLLDVPGGADVGALAHRVFDAFRLRGEWFAPARELLDLVDAFRMMLEPRPIREERLWDNLVAPYFGVAR